MKESEHQSRATGSLHASENGLRQIIDNIPGFVWTNTASGEIELVNRHYLDYLGKTLDEVKDWPTALHPADRARVQMEWSRSVETGEPFHTEVRIRRADGACRWFYARGVSIRDNEGLLSVGIT